MIDGDAGGTAITFAELLARGAEAPVATVHPDPASLAGLIYTSGTTGNPKGVMLSHANLTSNINTYPDLFDIGPDDRTASFLPWAHSFGQVVELHFILGAGASAGLTSAQDLMEDLPVIKPTILVSVPTVYNRIYDGLQKLMASEGGIKKMMFDQAMRNARKRSQLAAEDKTNVLVELQQGLFDQLVFSKVRDRFGGRLKYAFSGGAAISPEVAEFISALGLTVYEGYGLTETSPVAAANYLGTRKVGTVGKEIPGVRIDIDTDAVGSEDVGEIVIHGPNVMMGYYNLPEEDAAVFTPDGGFRSGDLGSRDEDGFISIRGRIKEQYKLENGKYVVPSPIEEQLQLSGFVTNIMVYGEQRPLQRGSHRARSRCPQGVGRGERPRRPLGPAAARGGPGRRPHRTGAQSAVRPHQGLREGSRVCPHRRGVHAGERHADPEPQGEAAGDHGEVRRPDRRAIQS